MPARADLRNLAIIAHVDHGKTTLVDALLRQSGAFRAGAELTDRVMDSLDLEREKGITILAKTTAIDYEGVRLNIVDTPGHADFGGEVERGLTMVDGVLLLVDAAEGPLPQTRFVLRKAIEADLPVILVINKIDRSDARIAEVVEEVEHLLLELATGDHHLELPVVYTIAREGKAGLDPTAVAGDLRPLLDLVISHVPAPTYEEGHPLQAIVTNLDASPYLGRLALCRIQQGTMKRGQIVAWCRDGGNIERVKVTELYISQALDRVPADEVGPGELVAVAGIPEITIGDTLADPDDVRPLPRLVVDEPSISMTIGINTSPLAGREGKKLTARLVKSRLDAEVVGNVSIRVLPTERPDAWEVQGRGELQLAVLVETMRREGFELTVGKPVVLTREIDGKLCEPMERVTLDVPEEHVGAVTQLLAVRKGELLDMVHSAPGGQGEAVWVRVDYKVPARGLLGFRTQLLTETRGTAVLHHVFDGWAPWAGEIRTRTAGSMVADRTGTTSMYTLMNLDGRGLFYVSPGTDVYEGMVVGANTRQEDMDVNPTKERKLNNIRSSTAEELVRLTPPRILTLEAALETMADDECVEVTPANVRLRKVILEGTLRGRMAKRSKADASV